MRNPRLVLPAALAAALALAPGRVLAEQGAPADTARLRFGGAFSLAAPTGEFAHHVNVAGGLSGHALYGGAASPLALRLDGGWMLYGTHTLRRPVPGTDGRVLEDVATTDNWIAHLSLGPQLMARSGRLRPYANAFAGASYFATSSELVRPRFDPTLRPGPFTGQDPFRTTTHYDDFTSLYGAGVGLLVGMGHGHAALDLGVRYVANGRVRFLTQDDPLDTTPRRSQGHLVEFRIGVSGPR
jgi:hypothetical protein